MTCNRENHRLRDAEIVQELSNLQRCLIPIDDRHVTVTQDKCVVAITVLVLVHVGLDHVDRRLA